MKGGYVLLDLRNYNDGQTSIELREKLIKIIELNKTLFVQVNEGGYTMLSPIHANIGLTRNNIVRIDYILNDEYWAYTIDATGEITITDLPLAH